MLELYRDDMNILYYYFRVLLSKFNTPSKLEKQQCYWSFKSSKRFLGCRAKQWNTINALTSLIFFRRYSFEQFFKNTYLLYLMSVIFSFSLLFLMKQINTCTVILFMSRPHVYEKSKTKTKCSNTITLKHYPYIGTTSVQCIFNTHYLAFQLYLDSFIFPHLCF